MMQYPRLFVKSLFLFSTLSAALLALDGSVSLTLSVNGTTEVEVYRGWPLLVDVRAVFEDGEPVPLQWPSPVHLTIRDATAAVIWPLQLAATPEGVVTVAEDRTADALWSLSGDATLALKTGTYTVQADHPACGKSRVILLKISDEPAELSREQGSLKGRLRSRYEEVAGTREAALQILDDWLATMPDDIAVLSQKADLLDDMERFADALNSAELALRAFRDQFKQAPHPPFALLRRIRGLQDKAKSN